MKRIKKYRRERTGEKRRGEGRKEEKMKEKQKNKEEDETKTRTIFLEKKGPGHSS